MPIDIGTALVGAGNNFANALVQRKQRMQQEQQLAIENALKQDELAMRQQQFARQSANDAYDQQFKVMQNFAGQEMPTEQANALFTHPALQGIATKQLQPRLASTSLQGVTAPNTEAGAPGGGFIAEQDIAARPEGMSQIQTPVSEGMRIAQVQNEGATDRARLNAELRGDIAAQAAAQRDELTRLKLDQQRELSQAHNAIMLAVAGMRGNNEPMVEVKLPDGRIVYRRRSEAEGMEVPQTQVRNNLVSQIAELEAVNKTIEDALTLGDKIKWAGTGPVAGKVNPFIGKLPVVGAMWTDPQEEELRQKTSNAASAVRHERYGAALTGVENIQASKFIPDIEQNSVRLPIALRGIYDFNKAKLDRMRSTAGQQPPPGGPPAGGASTIDVVMDAKGNLIDKATGKPIQ